MNIIKYLQINPISALNNPKEVDVSLNKPNLVTSYLQNL